MKKAWVVAVDMGYGHQRAAFPLKDIAFEKIFTANNDKIISKKETRVWERTRNFYEFVSRITSVPIIGPFVFWLYDRLQNISSYYPIRDLSTPNLFTLYLEKMITKDGLCSSVVNHALTKELPFVTTFFLTAHAADHAGIKKVYCIVTDTDINRIWVANKPKKSNIVYLAPSERVVKRLTEYGVESKKIILTGFPLPKENLGNRTLSILKKDVAQRISDLDPNRVFYDKYREIINKRLNIKRLPKRKTKIQLTFTIGGAGAQKEISLKLMRSLRNDMENDKIVLNVVAGMHLDFVDYLKKEMDKLKITKNFHIIFGLNKPEYFTNFSKVLRTTHVLWTKPSEMSFYCALGLPIIISPPIGAHEKYNKRWLFEMGAGMEQKNVKFTNQWLFDIVNSGWFAKAAWSGFINAPNKGIFEIEDAIFKH